MEQSFLQASGSSPSPIRRLIFYSLKIRQNVSLKPYHTFGLDVNAKEFVELASVEDVQEAYRLGFFQREHLILGGGSNILFTGHYPGLVLHNAIKGIHVLEETQSHVLLDIKSGENWHELVLHCVQKGWHGIENLSLIPGSVGAAPIQNIGAYGIEIKDVLESVEFFDLNDGKTVRLKNEACDFGYRDSVFKRSLKGKVFILSIRLKLLKKAQVNTSYGAISAILEERGIENPNLKDVSDAVISIRKQKLPDPKVLGNSGSFFKNPIVSKSLANSIQRKYPDVKIYPVSDTEVKVPAGWLIEKCGWKGKVVGQTGSHKNQALVLVNYGNASGAEVYQLAKDIIASVKEQFDIELVPEVNII
jgi:UDP-N-acetylmuramate dehydrogenase